MQNTFITPSLISNLIEETIKTANTQVITLELASHNQFLNYHDGTTLATWAIQYHIHNEDDGDYNWELIDIAHNNINKLCQTLATLATQATSLPNPNGYKVTLRDPYEDPHKDSPDTTSCPSYIIQGLGELITVIQSDLSLIITFTGWQV